jgi:hypothetical protein
MGPRQGFEVSRLVLLVKIQAATFRQIVAPGQDVRPEGG